MTIHNITNRLITQTIEKLKREEKAEARRKKASTPPRASRPKKVAVLSDGNSLYLELSTVNIGKGTWRLRFMHNKTRYVQTLGYFYYSNQTTAGISLKDARQLAPVVKEALISNNKESIRASVGPTVRKTTYTFDYMFNLYKSSKELRENSIKAFERDSRKLKKVGLGDYSIEELNLATLEKHIKQSDIDTSLLSSIRSLNTLRNYGTKLDLFPPLASLDIKLLYKIPEVKHHKQLTFKELVSVINWLEANKDSFNKSYLFTIVILTLTLCRINEIINLEESDLKIKEDSPDYFLHIPKERMKNKLDHILPIDELTFNLLKYYQKYKTTYDSLSKLNRKYKNCTDQKLEFTFHGFRSTGASILNELAPKHVDAKDVGDFSNIISMCLSHAHKQSKVDAIYNRYNYFSEKQAIMYFWSSLLYKNSNLQKLINYLLAK